MNCANGCGKELEEGLLLGTCCSKKCADELTADIDMDKVYEHESDYALEMQAREEAEVASQQAQEYEMEIEANNTPQE